MMAHTQYPCYKQSGVEWLGDVPKHWEVCRLKYTASINDEALSETTDPDYELAYVDIGSVDAAKGIVATETYRFEDAPSRARRIVRDGDTIVSTVRTYLRAIAAIRDPDNNLIVSTGFAVVRPRTLDPGYLSYAMRSPFFVETVVSRSTGVSYPAINAPEVGNIGISMPPLDEQKAIAAFLDRETGRIDRLIAKKQRQIELLAEKRSALISHAVTKGLDPNAPMKPSGIEWLGDVPDHWEVLAIKRITSIPITDGPHETPELLDEGIPFISAEAIKNDEIDFSKMRGYISHEEHARFSRKYKPKRGDVYLIKSGATTGNVAFVDTDEEFNIWSPLAVIRPHPQKAITPFVFFFMKSRNFFQAIELGWSYGTQQNIGMNVIENIPIVRPPLDEQKAIAAFLDRETGRIDRLIAKVRYSIEKLQEFRTALISAAVTGKIDVRGGNN